MSSQLSKQADPQYFECRYKINIFKQLLVAFTTKESKQKYVRTIGYIHKVNYSEKYALNTGKKYCKVFFFTVPDQDDNRESHTFVLKEELFYYGNANASYTPLCEHEVYSELRSNPKTAMKGQWLKKILGGLTAPFETSFSTSPVPSPAPQRATSYVPTVPVVENSYDPSQDVDQPTHNLHLNEQKATATTNKSPVPIVPIVPTGKNEAEKSKNPVDDDNGEDDAQEEEGI
jgi:hypothetical protein